MEYIFVINDKFLLPLMFMVLFAVGVYISVKIRFFFILKPKKVISALKDDSEKSSFRALTVALAGTLGVGNIVGVADAIRLGGSGSIFWMIVCSVISMSLKYAEVVLAEKHQNGAHGGAYYYIKYALNKPKIANIFSVLCLITSFTLGNIIQSRAVSDSVKTAFNIPMWLSGILLFLLCAFVIFGGFKRISDFTLRLIPSLCVLYTVLCLVIIVWNYRTLPSVCRDIVKNAFNIKSVGVGACAYGMVNAVKYGCMRGVISNEAGCGTAPIAHSTAKTNSPAKQGCYGIFEVFTDTVLLCTLSAIVFLIYPTDTDNSMNAVIGSFSRFYGKYASVIISVMIVFFAFATLVCWSFYGVESLYTLTASKKAKKLYLIVFCIFSFLGCVIGEKAAWSLSDFSVSVMTIINCICLSLLSKDIVSETKIYLSAPLQRRHALHNHEEHHRVNRR